MTIQNLKDILNDIPTFTASTINTFQSGKAFEYPNEGDKIYPLLFLEEDYLINVIINNNQPNQENWSIAILVLDQLDMDTTKDEKDTMRDVLLAEGRNIVKYLRQQILALYQGVITDVSYLSLLDYEQDNCQGWRIELTVNTASGENKCLIYG
jgi:hypothetical protein